jgi:hypothetical protein
MPSRANPSALSVHTHFWAYRVVEGFNRGQLSGTRYRLLNPGSNGVPACCERLWTMMGYKRTAQCAPAVNE